jgi:endonuclease YncB( thermonuclease family)
MSKSSLIVCVALVAAIDAVHAQRPTDLVNRRFVAEVTHVADGDTVEVLVPPARKVRVRLHGVDTPESNEPFNDRARTFTRVLMFGRTVTIAGKEVDRYGRLVARVTVDDIDASESIIAAGMGCTFRQYAREAALDAAQDNARNARRGFWANGTPQPACVAREARLQRATPRTVTAVVGNVNSRVYHLPTCPNANCKNCTRRFATQNDAAAAGFKPAGDCISSNQ